MHLQVEERTNLNKLILRRVTAGEYVTQDGKYLVTQGFAYTECDEPHPVRLGKDRRQGIREDLARYTRNYVVIRWGGDAVAAVENCRPGYFCPGGVEHAYVSWGVWDIEKNDYVSPGAIHFDKKSEAAEFLKDYLEKN